MFAAWREHLRQKASPEKWSYWWARRFISVGKIESQRPRRRRVPLGDVHAVRPGAGEFWTMCGLSTKGMRRIDNHFMTNDLTRSKCVACVKACTEAIDDWSV